MFEELEKLMKENQEVLIRMKNEEGPLNPVFETDGYRNGDPIYCPVNAYGECPYCDQCNMCHVADPIEDCDDFASFFESWDDWVKADDDPCAGCPNNTLCRTGSHMCEDLAETFAEDEIRWAGDVYGYEDTMEDNEE